MSTKYKFTDKAATYFTTSTIVGWIDLPAAGKCFYKRLIQEYTFR